MLWLRLRSTSKCVNLPETLLNPSLLKYSTIQIAPIQLATAVAESAADACLVMPRDCRLPVQKQSARSSTLLSGSCGDELQRCDPWLRRSACRLSQSREPARRTYPSVSTDAATRPLPRIRPSIAASKGDDAGLPRGSSRTQWAGA